MEVGVEKKVFVNHLHTLCQKEFMALKECELGESRSVP